MGLITPIIPCYPNYLIYPDTLLTSEQHGPHVFFGSHSALILSPHRPSPGTGPNVSGAKRR